MGAEVTFKDDNDGKSGHNYFYKDQLDAMTQETSTLISAAKEKYFHDEGSKLLDPSLGAKKYWSIRNIFCVKRTFQPYRHCSKMES